MPNEHSPSGDQHIARILLRARQELLDLSARNRLISTPRESLRSKRLDVVDERSDELFRLLVREKKALSFLSAPEPEETSAQAAPALLSQPEDEDLPPDRHTDLRLQTKLTSERLQRRLLDLYGDARTFVEEQGVNILYLALGFLKWYETPAAEKRRYAPLLLVPVDLDRSSATSRFRIRYRDGEIATNLSLQAKLLSEFGITLPDVPDDDAFSPSTYFAAVSQAVAGQPRWEVCADDVVLWFFSFAKYLMYRDLDPRNWPEHAALLANPTLSALLRDGFPAETPLCGEDENIDALIDPQHMLHVTDADSSQTLVIEEVRRGRNLVVQGPPGTGKSQTITNMIAAAVQAGKRVLFVAEKLAALEVVKSRLDRLGLGPLCLELHSHNANKKQVVEEIKRTLELGRPAPNGFEGTVESLRKLRDRLNEHATLMNTPLDPAGLTPFQVIGRLVRMYGLGARPLAFQLPEAPRWSSAEFEERCALVRDAETHLHEIGAPSQHPWRGVALAAPPLPTDLKQWLARVAELRGWLGELRETARQFSATLGLRADEAPHSQAVAALARFARKLLEAPRMERSRMASPVWRDRPQQIAELVEDGKALSSCRAFLEGRVAGVAAENDLTSVRRELAAHGRSWLRWLRGSYRKAVATLRGLMIGELPQSLEDRLAIVDSLIKARKLARALDDAAGPGGLGCEAFGALWKGSGSNWIELEKIVAWEQDCRQQHLPEGFCEVVSRFDDAERCRAPLEVLSDRLARIETGLAELSRLLQIDLAQSFGTTETNLIPLAALIERLAGWQGNPESLSKWIACWARCQRLVSIGLAALVDDSDSGKPAGAGLLARFQLAYCEALLRELLETRPGLATFDGQTFEQWIAEFRRLDRRRIELARFEVAQAHYESLPRTAGLGEVAIVRREAEKKRNLKPIRMLLKEAGTAVQAIKPVFMMSPISVAQFLDPGALTFDLLLIDEASQVQPVDAFGAVARAKQIVVVGDSKQLPPTRFFTKLLEDETPDGGEDLASPADLESVLGLCLGQKMLERTLRWHYRSRHHSLIAVSNREFYESRLLVIPSPARRSDQAGLQFRFVEEGVFDRGGTATNRVEAQAVARAALEHARHSPGQSLGIGAFSVAQRDAIRDELELLLRQDKDVQEFFAAGRSEPFFIKNLENIQGDERDVIFISVGYARDASGFLAMNFGPLSTEGGERRLNVLISRARERCDVFSSITADAIDLERGKSRGVAAFKTFLRYAQTGELDEPSSTERAVDSDFERQVADALQALGYKVDMQVGSAGFVIDLAVVDPEEPGRYVLGIECDGATYQAARAARDRDRLREQVLADRGWAIHRLWSVDWLHRPQEQLKRLVAAIEQARRIRDRPADAATLGPRRESPAPAVGEKTVAAAPPDLANPGPGAAAARATAAPGLDPIPREQNLAEVPEAALPGWVVPYVEANFAVSRKTPIHRVPPERFQEIVLKIVGCESPVHRDEVARRVASLWGLERAGSRVVETVGSALAVAVQGGRLTEEGDFVALADQQDVPVRNRQSVDSPTLRKPDMIPPLEIRSALRRLVADNFGASRDELRPAAGRCFGFRATSAQLKELIDQQITALVASGCLTERDGKLLAGTDLRDE